MPIVNLSNYTECCSCHRLAHIPGNVANADCKGNRDFMCQDCYEWADLHRPDTRPAKLWHNVSCASLKRATAGCDCGGLDQGVKTNMPAARATEDKRLDAPSDLELLHIFVSTNRRGFYDRREEYAFAISLFIDMRSKQS